MILSSVLLEVRCERQRHLLAKVVDMDAGWVIEAPRYADGRERPTWVPRWFVLTAGSGHRYGCACGTSALVRDQRLADVIASGYRKWIVRPASLSRTRRSARGESAFE